MADHARGQHAFDRQGFALPGHGIQQRPLARRHGDFGQLLAGGAEFMHVAGGSHGVGRGRQEGLVGRFVGVPFRPAGVLAAQRALGAAVGHHGDLAQAGGDRRLGPRQVPHERRAADGGGVDVGFRQLQVFGQRQARQAALGGGAEQAVHVLDGQSAVVQGAVDALGHQVQRRIGLAHGAQVGFGRARHHGAAGSEIVVHHADSSGVNTATGSSRPSSAAARKRTRWPMATSRGSAASTRLIIRNPSSRSISATL